MDESSVPSPLAEQPVSATKSPTKKSSSKVLVGIIVLLILIILGGLGYYTYTSNLFGSKTLLSQKSTTTDTTTKSDQTYISPLKNKIVFTKTILSDQEYTETGPGAPTLKKTDSDVYSMNPDGTSEAKIFDFDLADGYHYISDISLSPQAKYLVWLKTVVGGTDVLSYADLSSAKAEAQAKTLDSEEGIQGFVFSPDEKNIVVTVGSKGPAELPSEATTITTKIFRLSDGSLVNKFETVSGSGNDSERIRVGSGAIYWLDNSHIVTIGRKDGHRYIANFSIVDGLKSEKKILTSEDLLNTFALNSKNQMLFATSVEPEDLDIFLSDLNGANKKKLTTIKSGGNLHIPAFSPDGNMVALSTNLAEGTQFLVVNLMTGDVAATYLPIFGAYWSPQSDQLVGSNGVYSNKISLLGKDGKVIKDLTSESSQDDKAGVVSGYSVLGWVK